MATHTESNWYCTRCEKDISADEECGKIHAGKKARCGGVVVWRTYRVTILKTLIMVDRRRVDAEAPV